MIMAGFPEPEMSPPLERFISRARLGGVILFRRNVQTQEQTRALVSDLQRVASRTGPGWPLLVAIDEEGGRVTRLPLDPQGTVTARELGLAGSEERVASFIGKTCHRLRDFGVNTNFSPVLDVDTNPVNPVIGDRSFGSDPRLVSRMGRAAIRAYKKNGIFCCAKHFPGHGDTSTDSHLELPVVSADPDRMEKVELVPFRMAARERAEFVMTAHVLYPKLDKTNPATCSRVILQGLLREKLGYRGLIVSDDLEMKGIEGLFPFETAIRKAVTAGVDVLLICHQEEKVRSAIDILLSLVKKRKIPMDRIDEAVLRIRKLKRRLERPGW